jgi:hypothetical protein
VPPPLLCPSATCCGVETAASIVVRRVPLTVYLGHHTIGDSTSGME